MRAHLLPVIALAALAAACGDTRDDRAASGGLGGAAVGAVLGGPIGALVGGGIGYAGGVATDASTPETTPEELASRPQEGDPPPPPRPAPRLVPASASVEHGMALTPAQVETRLNEVGYTPVHAIRREGAAYVARGERDGTLYDVRVEAATGRLLASREVGTVRQAVEQGQAPVMTEQQLRSTLRKRGYEMVGDVARSGDRYRAEAMRDGRIFDLVVDGRTGRVVSSMPSTASGAPPPRRGG